MSQLAEIYRYRDLIWNMVQRDLRGRYRGSVLGFLWTFVNPLLMLVIYSLVFQHVMKVGMRNYSVFLFACLLPWLWTQTTLARSSGVLVQQANLVKKVYFPVEILPLMLAISGLLNFLFSLPILLLALLVVRMPITWAVLWAPAVMVPQFLFTLALALLVSSVTVYFRDLEHIVTVFTMAWFYVTPVIFPVEMVPPSAWWLFRLNPMLPIIDAYRRIFYDGVAPDWASLSAVSLLSLLFTVVALKVFAQLRRRFAEEL